jgi:hypothetical protein
VTWIRLTSVTHSFNENQRLNRLSFSTTTGGLTVTTPANANLSPPGHYMLFIVNGTGVPSVAKIVQIEPGVGGGPTTIDVPPEADTYIYQSDPNTNFGTSSEIRVGGPPFRRDTFLRFNVTLPTNAQVTDARLLVTVLDGGFADAAQSGGTIRKFAPTTEQWSELQPTFNNPLPGSDASGDLASLGPVNLGQAYQFTGLQSAITGSGRVTFVIRSSFEDGAGYHSKDSPTVARRPILRITYTAP